MHVSVAVPARRKESIGTRTQMSDGWRERLRTRIADMGLTSGFRAGDILVGQKVRGHGLSNVVGVECIVLTKDGTKVVGVLLQGATPGTHSIRPLDIRRSELRDVTVEWAAPIRMIIRGQ